jgi:predicted RNA binding protein YcfA (HicA-like mRNA interferase family)
MGAGYYAQVLKLLVAAGCTQVRQGKGSHEIWFSPITHANFTIPANLKYRNLANAILKQAGIATKV